MEIPQNKTQIKNARSELVRKGVSSLETPIRSFMRRLGLVSGIRVGDYIKSWDLLSTVTFLEQYVKKMNRYSISVALHLKYWQSCTN
jgi:hypothetical protein